MIAIRGVLTAFDHWAERSCQGWSGAEVCAPFQQAGDRPRAARRVPHGRHGPIPICRVGPEEWGPVDRALRDAALALGHNWCDDLNAPEAEGVCTYAINQRDGRWVSTNDVYPEPARGRPNLTIVGEATVAAAT